jgi:hypothetical protein
MTTFDLNSYLAEAQEELWQKQADLGAEYGIGTHERFVLDYVDSTLDFFQHEAPKVRTTIIPVATHVPEKRSLKWAWANEQYSAEIRAAASRIKQLAELTGYKIFQTDFVQCDETRAWEITALACKLHEAKGAYRVPHGKIHSYVLITDVKRAP